MNAAVSRIAHDRMADGAQVHSYLMSAAGVDRHLAQREPGQMVSTCYSRHGVPGATGARRHLETIGWIPSDCGFDSTSGLHDAPDESDIFLFDLVVMELTRQFVVSGVVFGHYHET